MSTALEFFATPTGMTAPKRHAAWLDELPADVTALCHIVQGVMIHLYWMQAYGVPRTRQRDDEANLRAAAKQLGRIRELDPRPLTAARAPDCRVTGTCRDFTVLLTALLRAKGIPARARCGFGRYFLPNHYEDHWVCEYWNADQQRWVFVDAQLDELIAGKLELAFDPLDVPRDQFVVAGEAWSMYRAGTADPETFGIFDLRGMGFIRGNLVRDVAALNKVELLPWDGWGIIMKEDTALDAEDYKALDRAAELTGGDVPAWEEVQTMYATDARFRVPEMISSFSREGIASVDVSEMLA